MQKVKRFFKWLFYLFVFLFILLSIIPYLFESKGIEAPKKPFKNSYFLSYNKTSYHFQLFIPKHIKHKTILIHGFSGSTFTFRNNTDSLLKNESLVVAIDMPSFGFSDKTETANYTDTNFINATHVLMQQINMLTTDEKWNLVGHSMGAIAIGKLASKYPSTIKSLIFIDGLPFNQSHSFLQKALLYPPNLKLADVVLEKKFLNFLSFKELLSSAYNEPADDFSVDGYLNPFKTKGSGSGIIRMFANMGYQKINDSIINTFPKLVIWGKDDQWIPFNTAKEFIKKPKTTLLLIEHTGHCPMETKPNEVNLGISKFMTTLE